MRLFLTFKIWKEGRHYIAYNPELEVASQGKTQEEAAEMLKDAIKLFLETTKKMGTLPSVLREAGFVPKEKKWISPSISISSLEVKV